MQMPPKRDEPAKRPQPAPQRGAPSSYAAHAERKNVSVRVRVRPTTPDSEELREDGYGHGV